MRKRVFLSHNHADKPFVRKLATDLENHGVKCWLDEIDIEIGDSLIKKIREGIDNADFFAIILSPNSITAPWVVNELDVAMNYQVYEKVKILPIMLKDCELPSFLIGKLYADFKNDNEYEESFKKLLKSIGVVFNKNALNPQLDKYNLWDAVDKAIYYNLPIMKSPFYRPFQYLGMTIPQAEKELSIKSNDVGNIIVDNEECRMFLEAEGNFVSYIEVEIKRTIPHYLNKEFDSEPLLGALSIGLSELELIRKQTHFHTYYDHRKKLKVSVSCPYDGSPLMVAFSSKYYGM